MSQTQRVLRTLPENMRVDLTRPGLIHVLPVSVQRLLLPERMNRLGPSPARSLQSSSGEYWSSEIVFHFSEFAAYLRGRGRSCLWFMTSRVDPLAQTEGFTRSYGDAMLYASWKPPTMRIIL